MPAPSLGLQSAMLLVLPIAALVMLPAARAQRSDVPIAPLPATFAGTLPCADCPGIRYQLNLFADRVFYLRMSYLERNSSIDDVGRWLWSPDQKTLVLQGTRATRLMFSLRDRSTLRLLNTEGKEITSGLNYDIKRSSRVEPFEPTLDLTGRYRYLADAGIFTDCATGRRVFVAQERDNAALEKAYSGARPQPGSDVMVRVEGRFVSRPNPDTKAQQPTLVVERFVAVVPGDKCAGPASKQP